MPCNEMITTYKVYWMLQTRHKTKLISISEIHKYVTLIAPTAVPLSQYVTRTSCISKQSGTSKSRLDRTGSSSEIQRPETKIGTRAGGSHYHTQGTLVTVDLEGLINTSAISKPNSKCHYAMWFGKLQAPIFRQVGFIIRTIHMALIQTGG